MNSSKLLAINLIIGIHAAVQVLFLSDGLWQMLGKQVFSDEMFIFISYLNFIMLNLVMTVASYYWIGLLLMLNNSNFDTKKRMTKIYLFIMVAAFSFMIFASLLMLVDSAFMDKAYSILRYSDLVFGTITKFLFAVLCLILVDQLKQIYNYQGSHLRNMKILSIVSFIGTIISTVNEIYYVIWARNPQSIEVLANNGVAPDVYIWTIFLALVSILSDFIPMMFSLMIFRPTKLISKTQVNVDEEAHAKYGLSSAKTSLLEDNGVADDNECVTKLQF